MRTFCFSLAFAAVLLGLPTLAGDQGGGGYRPPRRGSMTSRSPEGRMSSSYQLGPSAYVPASAAKWTREVGVRDNYFSPSFLVVPAGTLVRWKNEGKHQHTVTFSPLVDSGPLTPGGEYAAFFGTSGTYYYRCVLHGREMTGTVEVH
jgi:plastocyanin